MVLPVSPPLPPMLARLSRALPTEDVFFEPKWDGFRCLVFRDGDDVDLRSRNDRPLARYFPELVTALRGLPVQRVVLDGEILVVAGGRADFAALMARLHPAASRAERLARETPASFVAFDVLAVGDTDLRTRPFTERRRRLCDALAGAVPPLHVTPSTRDRDVAGQWLAQAGGGGLDGVVAKPSDLRYEPGRRAMTKVKPERTAECVVAGCRIFADPAGIASLLLGLHDGTGALRHVGVASAFSQARRRELLVELVPSAVPLAGHPWEHGFGIEGGRVARLGGAATVWAPGVPLDWQPLRPERVCEVAYTNIDEGRFRHPARFVRWRPDRDAASCTLEQVVEAGGLGDVLTP